MQIDTVLTVLHRKHSALNFLSADAHSPAATAANISHVPTVHLAADGRLLDVIEGARAIALTRRIVWLSAASADERLDAACLYLKRSAPVVLFMKGSPDQPRCGFSRQMVTVLRDGNVSFKYVDILADQDVRERVKKLADWPTYPQLYAHGSLVGGLDVTRELADTGKLDEEIAKRANAPAPPPREAAKSDAGAADPSGSVASGATAAVPELDAELTARLRALVRSSHVMLFMKGAPDAPRCGFSRKITALLAENGVEYGHFDILTDDVVRQGLKKMSDWPTYPQLYANGKLVGGLDIAKELSDAGALRSELGMTESGATETLEDRMRKLVAQAPVMLFMKGKPDAPQCGFSRKIVGLLTDNGVEYGHFDILTDEEVRQGLKTFSQWPTYPQLYAGGRLVGGLDIAKELADAGALLSELGLDGGAGKTERRVKLDRKTKTSELSDRLGALVAQAPVMLFMKGSPDAPQCGFSRKIVALLAENGIEYEHFDILTDDTVRQGLKTFSQWPTYPQLYAGGKLIGGLDIAKELADANSLRSELGLDSTAGKTERTDTLEDQLRALVGHAPVMLFMKGSPEAPQCGFSRKIVGLLAENKVKYGHFDILSDDAVRQGLKKYSEWPTYPQLYANGKLIGGLDIAKELAADGTLRSELGLDSATEITLEDRLRSLIGQAPVMLFMKGTPDAPQCGFSRKMVALLAEQKVEYAHFDILKDDAVRQALKKFSQWPTFPQLYANNKLVGGLDIATELAAAGSLRSELAVDSPQVG